jgi:DedD protein
MFNSRSGSPGNAQAAPPQSIEAVRRRARHRLIGAAVLVVLGVVGFPLLFDTQPRPIPVDIPIVIPAKNAQPPLSAPKAGHQPAGSDAPAAAAEKPAPVDRVAAGESLSAREEVVEAAGKDTAPAAKPEPKPVAKAEPAAQPAKPVATEAERARALLEGKATDKAADKPAADNLRIVVQVGAFADVARAREARLKLERAGLKTYTHVADTPDGKRIRVRVGPYATKAEADKAATRVKALGLPAAILTL